MSKTLTLDGILSSYVGRLETYKKVHQGLPEDVTHDKAYATHVTKQAILQWVADEVVAKDHKPYPYKHHPEVLSNMAAAVNEMKYEQREILKAHGWKEPS